jgi:hypothetical protein
MQTTPFQQEAQVNLASTESNFFGSSAVLCGGCGNAHPVQPIQNCPSIGRVGLVLKQAEGDGERQVWLPQHV